MRQAIYSVWSFIIENSFLLVIGAAAALIWANTDPSTYHALQEMVLIEHFFIGHAHVNEAGETIRTLTLHYLVNDVLMALFFALAGKEIWEAVALKPEDHNGIKRDKGGQLRGKTALTPLIATLGGMAGPALVYLGVISMLGPDGFATLVRGTAIPTATDIAFSYFVGRIVFGAKHPAVSFLLLLAVADDAGGLMILAIFYPSAQMQPMWLLLSLAVAVAAGLSCNYLPRALDAKDNGGRFRFMRTVLGPWPYVVAGCISWYAFQESGIHPALGLLPIIPAIPHADHDAGIFAQEERSAHDLLNVMEHAIKLPVQFVLFAFAFLNAGITITMPGEATYPVLFGLLLGKPLGIFLFGMFAAYVLRLDLPESMRPRDLWVLGWVAGIGFTVALFVSVVAFAPGAIQDQAKMGALLSILAALPAVFFGIVLRVKQSARRPETMTEQAERAVA